MSDNIPFEMQKEIIQRIPDTKSVIRYRSVSKAWKSVIDSKDFVTAHTLRGHHQTNRDLLMISKRDFVGSLTSFQLQVKYVSVVDDDTFPHQKHKVFVPDSVNKLLRLPDSVVGVSHGLFCLYNDQTGTAVIWNPSIRKTVATKVPNVSHDRRYSTAVGFGVCPRNLDPKLVKIAFASELNRLHHAVNASTQVEVFTLSSGGTWRSPLSSNLPDKSIRFGDSQIVIDGFIYWDAVDRINVDDGPRNSQLIMSFDLTTEVFTEINLPDPLALDPDADLSVSNLRESLAVLRFNRDTLRKICDVWMMIGYGFTRSFNRLYSIHSPDSSIRKTLGFRKSGAPIIELGYASEYNALAIYDL